MKYILSLAFLTIVTGHCPLGTALAQESALPQGNGTVLVPATLTYTVRLESPNQDITLAMTRTIAPATVQDSDVWRIIDAVQLPEEAGASTASDTFDVDKATLWPIRRSAGGQGTMRFRYTDTRIEGEMAGIGGTLPIAIDLETPVLGDGPGLVVALAGLPLADGYTTSFRSFDPLTQTVRPFKLWVQGTETTEVPAAQGSDIFIVGIEPLDSDAAGTATLHVMKDAPHHIIQGEYKLPDIMGGGTMRTTLTGRR